MARGSGISMNDETLMNSRGFIGLRKFRGVLPDRKIRVLLDKTAEALDNSVERLDMTQ